MATVHPRSFLAGIGRILENLDAFNAEMTESMPAPPDITDHHGRVWKWREGKVYQHCRLAWPREFVEDGEHGLPSERARTNPNYAGMCGICMGTAS